MEESLWVEMGSPEVDSFCIFRVKAKGWGQEPGGWDWGSDSGVAEFLRVFRLCRWSLKAVAKRVDSHSH